MSLDLRYDPENIFAKIIAGDLPCVQIAQDDHTLAFLDVFPQSRGHTLIVAKAARAVHLLDADVATLHRVIAMAHRVGNAIVRALAPAGLQMMQFSGAPAGQTVFHLHVHLIPVFAAGTPAAHGRAGRADPAELEATAELIRAAL